MSLQIASKQKIKQAKTKQTVKQIASPVLVSETEIANVPSLSDGIELVYEKKGKLNSQKAQEYLALDEFVGERPIIGGHVMLLASAMKRNTFREEGVEIISCEYNGTNYRINGQHTCLAVTNMPKNFGINVRFVHYKADSQEAMRTLYSTVDRGAPRTQGAVIVSLLAGTQGFSTISHETLRRLSEGMGMWLWQTKHQRRSHDATERASLIQNKYRNLSIRIGKFLDAMHQSGIRHMLRSPVIAAIFSTMENSKDGEEFWVPVRDGVNLNHANDPRLRLRNFLMGVGMRERGASLGKKRVPGEQMYRQCIHCWNAWKADQKLLVLRAPVTTVRPMPK